MDPAEAVRTGMAAIRKTVADLPTELPDGKVDQCQTCMGIAVCPIYGHGFHETTDGGLVAVGPFKDEGAKLEAYLSMNMAAAALTGALA